MANSYPCMIIVGIYFQQGNARGKKSNVFGKYLFLFGSSIANFDEFISGLSAVSPCRG